MSVLRQLNITLRHNTAFYIRALKGMRLIHFRVKTLKHTPVTSFTLLSLIFLKYNSLQVVPCSHASGSVYYERACSWTLHPAQSESHYPPFIDVSLNVLRLHIRNITWHFSRPTFNSLASEECGGCWERQHLLLIWSLVKIQRSAARASAGNSCPAELIETSEYLKKWEARNAKICLKSKPWKYQTMKEVSHGILYQKNSDSHSG